MKARAVRRSGEESAALYLMQNGYAIDGRNVHIGHYENDIIAHNATHLLCAEVKTRRAYPDVSSRFGRPAAAVDARKQSCLLSAARAYLSLHREEYGSLTPNIDVIEVYIDPSAAQYRVLEIRHFRNAVNGMKGTV